MYFESEPNLCRLITNASLTLASLFMREIALECACSVLGTAQYKAVLQLVRKTEAASPATRNLSLCFVLAVFSLTALAFFESHCTLFLFRPCFAATQEGISVVEVI